MSDHPKKAKRQALDQTSASQIKRRKKNAPKTETAPPRPRRILRSQMKQTEESAIEISSSSDYDSDIELQNYIERQIKTDMQKLDQEFQQYKPAGKYKNLTESQIESNDSVIILDDVNSPVAGPSKSDTVEAGVLVLDDSLPSYTFNCNQYDQKLVETENLLKDVNKILDELTDKSPKKVETKANVTSPMAMIRAPECPICMDRLTNHETRVITTCGHLFCKSCIKKALTMNKKCPTCRTKLTMAKVHPIFI